jgi:hypothetical protein
MLYVLVLKGHHQVLIYTTETKVNTDIEICKFVISEISKKSLQLQPNKKHTIVLDLK